MPRYDVFLEGRAESSTRYFAVSVMADDPKEAEFLGHEAGRVKHQECDEIEVVGVLRSRDSPSRYAENTSTASISCSIPISRRRR